MVHSIWKKGSLNLSVEAIVILVMAITMLGLGLGFIRDKFGGAGKLIDDVQEKVKEDVQRDLSNSAKKMSFPKTEFRLQADNSEVALVGLKNDGDSNTNFCIFIYRGDTSTLWNADVGGTGVGVYGTDYNVELTFSDEYSGVSPGEILLVPLKIKIHAGATKKSTIYVMNVYDNPTGGTCASSLTLFSSKQFFVKVI